MNENYNPNSAPENGDQQNGQEHNPYKWSAPQGQNNASSGWQAGTPYDGQQEQQASSGSWQGGAPYNGQSEQYSASRGWQKESSKQPVAGKNDPYQWNFSDYQSVQAARPRKRNKGLMVFAVVMAVIVILTLVSFAGVGIFYSVTSSHSTVVPNDPVSDNTLVVPADKLEGMTVQDVPQEEDETLPDGKLTTKQIVKQVSPSVVAITTYVNYQNYQAEGMGSGIIIREDGYIVTNAHVVNGAKGITVLLSDGETKYEGHIVGMDTKTDLAVIKIDATGLPAAVFGNSDQVEVGEKVIAIGNPQSLEFAGSVTEGIVSGLNRSLTATDSSQTSVTTYSNLIQTDAAINPGNSGGALVNEYGQVIGINSAKVVREGADGMGFAIPSNEAKPVVDDLINYGYVTGRVMLGVTASAVDEVLARLNNVPTGLFVQSTLEGSDISKKGVVPGDIITKADGAELDGFQSLTDVLEGKKPGETVELEIYRPATRLGESGTFFTVDVILMEDTGDLTTTETQQQTQPTQPAEPEETPENNRGYGYDDLEEFFNQFFN